MCNCINVEIGSYGNQVELRTPNTIKNRKKKWNMKYGTSISEEAITVDKCLKDEILKLWELGITTTGCCCGHNVLSGYIGVIDEDIPKMVSMGYENIHNKTDGNRKDSFIPKSHI